MLKRCCRSIPLTLSLWSTVCAQSPEPGEPAADAAALPANVSGGVLRADQACFDVRHCDLALAVDPAAQTIRGTLTMRARAQAPCAAIALDLDAPLSVTRVRWDGQEVAFRREVGRILVQPAVAVPTATEFEVAVDYGGRPRIAKNPPWVGGFTWSKTKSGAPWIATSCQGEGADLWWPCKDHPSDKPESFALHITVPDGLVVASNGTLQGQEPAGDGRQTFHWRVASPISNYCIALNIAPYEVVADEYTSVDGTKVPVQFFALPEHADKARRILPQFLDHVRVFEELLGPYPFRSEKYGIAETPHLGMEHQTIIAYGNRFADMRYDWLHNHELAHEWWGNLVTCRDWKDMWLHEGFGTYMQPLYLERRRGRKAYEVELRRNARFSNKVALAPTAATDSHAIYFESGGGNDIYYKGAWVLHTLRWELGDEQFFTCLRRFCYPTDAARAATDGSQVRLVDTEDFVALCSEVAGRDLRWFFAVYVRQPLLPRLRSRHEGGTLRLWWEVPGDLPFELAAPVMVGDRLVRVPMPGGKGELAVGAESFEVDPDRLVLRGKD